jgi:hypothetical protein
VADDLEQLEEGIGRRVVDALGRVWRPELHPRDRNGRFVSVGRKIANMVVGSSRSLNDVVDDAPNINQAYVFRTPRGHEIRVDSRAGKYGFNVTPEQLVNDPEKLGNQLASADVVDPFPDVSKCPHCGAPSPGGGYLPGHRMMDLLSKAASGVGESLRGVREQIRDLADESRTATEIARRAPTMREIIAERRGKSPKGQKVRRTPSNIISKAINRAIDERSNQFIYYDRDKDNFIATDSLIFAGEGRNAEGNLVLRGIVDSNGAFKSLKHRWALQRPDDQGTKSGRLLAEESLFADMPGYRRSPGRRTSRELDTPYGTLPEGTNLVAYDLRAQAKKNEEVRADLLSEIDDLALSDAPEDILRRDRLAAEVSALAERDRQNLQRADAIENGEPLPEVVDPLAPDAPHWATQVDLIHAEREAVASRPSSPENEQRLRELEVEEYAASINSGDRVDFELSDEQAIDQLIAIGNANPETRKRLVEALTPEQRKKMAMAGSEIGGVLSDPRRLRENRTAIDQARRELEESEAARLDNLQREENLRIGNMLNAGEFREYIDEVDTGRIDAAREDLERINGDVREIDAQIKALENDLIRLEARNTDGFKRDELAKHRSKISVANNRLNALRESRAERQLEANKLGRQIAGAIEGKRAFFDDEDAFMVFSTEMTPQERLNFIGDLRAEINSDARKVKRKLIARADKQFGPDQKREFADEQRRIQNLNDDQLAEEVNNLEDSDPELLEAVDRLEVNKQLYETLLPAAEGTLAKVQADQQGTTLPPKTTLGRKAGKRNKGALKTTRRNGFKENPEFQPQEGFEVLEVDGELRLAPGAGTSDGITISDDGRWIIVNLAERPGAENLAGDRNVVLFRKTGKNSWKAQNRPVSERAEEVAAALGELNRAESIQNTKKDSLNRLLGDRYYDNYTSTDDDEELLSRLDETIARLRFDRDNVGNSIDNADPDELERLERIAADLDDQIGTLSSERVEYAAKIDEIDRLKDDYGQFRLAARPVDRFKSVTEAIGAAKKLAAEHAQERKDKRQKPEDRRTVEDIVRGRVGQVRYDEIKPELDRLEEDIARLQDRHAEAQENGGLTKDGNVHVRAIEDALGRARLKFGHAIEALSEADLKRLAKDLEEANLNEPDANARERRQKLLETVNQASGAEAPIDRLDREIAQQERVLHEFNNLEVGNDGKTIRSKFEVTGYGEVEAEFKFSGMNSTINGVPLHSYRGRLRGLKDKRDELKDQQTHNLMIDSRDPVDDPDVLENHEATKDYEGELLDEFVAVDFSAWLDNPDGYYYGLDDEERGTQDEIFVAALADFNNDPLDDPTPRFVYYDPDERAFFYSKLSPKAYTDASLRAGKRPPRVVAAAVGEDNIVMYTPRRDLLGDIWHQDTKQLFQYFGKNTVRFGGTKDLNGSERVLWFGRRGGTEVGDAATRLQAEERARRAELPKGKGLADKPVTRGSVYLSGDTTVTTESRIAHLENLLSTLNRGIAELEDSEILDKDLFPDYPLAERARIRKENLEKAKRHRQDVESELATYRRMKSDPEGLVEQEKTTSEFRQKINDIKDEYDKMSNGRTAQVYLNEDGSVELKYSRSKDPNKRRIATITPKTGINWKDDEIRDAYENSERGIKEKLNSIFVGHRDTENGDLVLTSRVIDRFYQHALDGEPENRRAMRPATYRIVKRDDGTFALYSDGEGHSNRQQIGVFQDQMAALNAAYRYENNAIENSPVATRIPDNDSDKKWTLKNGQVVALPTNESLGQFRIGRVFYNRDGQLVERFVARRIVSGGDQKGVDLREHSTLEEAIADVNNRIDTGQRPRELQDQIDWVNDGEVWRGASVLRGERADYEITKRDDGRFSYDNRLFDRLEDAYAAAEQDERNRETQMVLREQGINQVEHEGGLGPPVLKSSAEPPREPAPKQKQQQRSAGLSTRPSKSAAQAAKDAKREKEKGKKPPASPFKTFDPERLGEAMKDVRDEKEFVDFLHDHGVFFDYETTGNPLSTNSKGDKYLPSAQPTQLGATRRVNGEYETKNWLIRVDPDKDPEFYDFFPQSALDEGRLTVDQLNGDELEKLKAHLRLYGVGFWRSFSPKLGEIIGKIGDENYQFNKGKAKADKIDPYAINDEQMERLLPEIDLGDLKYSARDFANALTPEEVHREYLDWAGQNGDFVMTGFNSGFFDWPIFQRMTRNVDLPPQFLGQFDGMSMLSGMRASEAWKNSTIGRDWPNGRGTGTLAYAAEKLGVELPNAHQATDDAIATGRLLDAIAEQMRMVAPDPNSEDRRNFRSKVMRIEGARTPDQIREQRINEEIEKAIDAGDFKEVVVDPPAPRDNSEVPEGRRIKLNFDKNQHEIDGVKFSDELRYDEPDPESGIRTITGVLTAEDGEGGIYTIDWHRIPIQRDVYKENGDVLKDAIVEYRGIYTLSRVKPDGEYLELDRFEAKDDSTPDPGKMISDPPKNRGGMGIFEVVNRDQEFLYLTSPETPTERVAPAEGVADGGDLPFGGEFPSGFSPDNPRHQILAKLKRGDTDPQNGQKIKNIDWTDRGPVVEYYGLTREEIDERQALDAQRAKRDAMSKSTTRQFSDQDEAELAKLIEEFEKILDLPEDERDESKLAEIEQRLDQFGEREIPVDMREQRGVDDMTQARRVMGSDEVPDYVGLEEIDDALDRADDEDGQRGGFASLAGSSTSSPMSASNDAREFASSRDAIRSYDILDDAMNRNLSPIRATQTRGEINDRILGVINDGGEFELSDVIDFDEFAAIRSAKITRGNGHLALVITRNDGSKVANYTKRRISDNSYFPWMHRALAYHGNGERPQALNPIESETLRRDAEFGMSVLSDSPSVRWSAHAGQDIQSTLMSRLGMSPLNNGYDGFVTIRRDNPNVRAYTWVDDNGVPHIDIHQDTLLDGDAVEKIIHENLHTMSPGILNPQEVIDEGLLGYEEGLVHTLAHHLTPGVSDELGFRRARGAYRASQDSTPYAPWAQAYESLRLELSMPPEEFYLPLLKLHPRKRREYLTSLISKVDSDDAKALRSYKNTLTNALMALEGPPASVKQKPSRLAKRLMAQEDANALKQRERMKRIRARINAQRDAIIRERQRVERIQAAGPRPVPTIIEPDNADQGS